jgi:hypothetical protein
MRGSRSAAALRALLAATSLAAGAGQASCTWLPHELNLSPIYRQRLAEDGTPLEVDVLWPVFHYERTPAGGDDFRIRPLYRRVTEPEQLDFVGEPAVEHQFLWPLGRHRSDGQQRMGRLFPLWWFRERDDDLGMRETDWYLLFPFVWGGTREDGAEDYLGVFPFFADLPDFLAYERLTFVLWPLYTRTERWGRIGHLFLWPLIGFGSGPDGYRWHRFLPLWSWIDEPDRLYRSILWPLLAWGTENRDGPDPLHRFWLWPLFGHQWSARISGWSFLFPLFQWIEIEGRRRKLHFLWPLFHFEEDRSEFVPLYRWWFWPLVAHTVTDRQDAWVWLWPLIWVRRLWDPEDVEHQTFVVPFYTRVTRERDDGSGSDFVRLWPLFHRDRATAADGTPVAGGFSLLSPWPWRDGNAYGVEEAYGWLWTLASGRQRAPDDRSFETAAHLFTTRQRGDRVQTSVPFLFNFEGDPSGGTLRLLQFIPISFGGPAAATKPVPGAGR